MSKIKEVFSFKNKVLDESKKVFPEALTFDDVLLVPQKSDIESRKDVNTSTMLSRNIRINIPIISSNMDTVTESAMAIAVAREGGLGIIHRFMSIEDQADEVKKVKRSEGILIEHPYTLKPEQTLEDALNIMNHYSVKGLLVTDINKKLIGILTSRDILFETDLSKKINDLMTTNIITAPVNTSMDMAKDILHKNRIEKLPLVDENGILKGLITAKDIIKKEQFPRAAKDSKGRLLVGAAIGVKDDVIERTSALLDANADIIVIDIAHGHAKSVIDTIKLLRKEFGNVEIMAGNVATKEAFHDLVSAGADSIKAGVGGGCFAAGTRILMSNGTYKNIEEIEPGNRVINKDGNPVNVKKSFCTGIKKVNKVRASTFYETTFVTPNHQYWVGDLNTSSVVTLQSRGYSFLLEQQSKTTPKQSKYKWKKIEDLKQDVFLLPKKIDFELPEDFKIILKKRRGGNWRTGHLYEIDQIIKPSYEIGYIFGTFLGDGTSHTPVFKGSHRGAVHWYFGLNEFEKVNKLIYSLLKVFKNIKPKIQTKTNIIKLSLYYKPLADFLSCFGKRKEKHLPEKYLINNKDYLKGLLHGLIDTDGHIEKEGRIRFYNTSKRLIELFNVASYLVLGVFPNNAKRKKSSGTLKNINLANCNDSYTSEIINTGQKRLTKNYQAVKILDIQETSENKQVYDLEIDCSTHSFIANNAIVHNSVCSTRIVTGSGVPQLSAIMDCAEAAEETGIPLVADGGIRYPGDITKAIGAGADTVMLGNALAGTDESPGNTLMKNGRKFKIYRGSAGYGTAMSRKNQKLKDVNVNDYVAEGVESLIGYKGSVSEVINQLLGGLRSGMSYSGARTIEELKQKAKFIKITSSGMKESKPHDVNVI